MLEFNKEKYIDKRVEEYKEEFVGLTDEQKKFKVFRKILEMKENGLDIRKSIENAKNNANSMTYYLEMCKIYDVFALIKAADFEAGIFAPMIFAIKENSEEDYRKVYKESLKSYQNILDNYKKLAKELNIETSLELSHLFSYLLWNGYFSVTKQHSYKLQNRLLLPSMQSFDIINGQGVCLAYSELLNNFLRTCDKESAMLECYVPTKKGAIKPIYRPDIERKIESNIKSKIQMKLLAILLGGIVRKTGNHAVTLIRENDKIYVYDPTNLYVLNIKDSQTATIINGEGEFQIKPISSYIMETNVDPNNIFESLFYDNIKPAYTQNDIYQTFEKIVELSKDNITLLDDAYNEIHSDLELIQKETKENGGIFKVLKKIQSEK